MIKEKADSIKLLNTVELICYNYQPHEHPPLGAWESLNKLGKAIQPENVLETDHYETIKTIVEVCKASGVNFALMCTHTVDMVISTLAKEGLISKGGKFKDGTYFDLDNAERELVNDKAEETCIATRLLSLSSNKKFSASKQELRNDLVKGKGNYPRTVSGVLKYLHFHSLRDNMEAEVPVQSSRKHLETVFVTEYNHKTSDSAHNQKKQIMSIVAEGGV